MTDVEKLNKLKQDVLAATKWALETNAPGLPVAALAQVVRQMGGDILMVDEEMKIDEFTDKNPFRLCVTTEKRPNFEQARQLTVVDKVIGWG